MSFVAVLFAAGLAMAGTQSTGSAPEPTETVDQADGGTLNGGGGTKKKKKGGKKKGNSGGKKKKGGKKKGNSGGKSESKPAIAPWGKSSVLVTASVGYNHAIAREAEETGEEDADDGGSSASSCVGDDCTTADTDTNAASGWGPASRFSIAFPGLGGLSNSIGPQLTYSRHGMSLTGLEHTRLADDSDSSLAASYVTDRADYELSVQQLKAGLSFATKFRPKSPGFMMFTVDFGYAWGTVDTTLASAPNQVVSGGVGGGVVGVDFALGLSLGKHAHLVLSPFAVDWMMLTPDNGATFPFLTDSQAMTTTVLPKLGVMAAF